MGPARRSAGRPAGPLVVVVGAGYFGSRALAELRARHPDRRLAAIDHDPVNLERWDAEGIETHLGDAVSELDGLLAEEVPPRWIVPAVPLHLAHAWILYRLSGQGAGSGSTAVPLAMSVSVPSDLPLPHPLEAPTGDLYCGYSSFRCPEDCPEPRGRCFVTGESRPMPLFGLLARLEAPGYRVLGVRSHQLAPGVGGYRGSDLLGLLGAVEAAEAAEGDLLLYTACRCQGVLSGLRVSAVVAEAGHAAAHTEWGRSAGSPETEGAAVSANGDVVP